MAIEGFDYKGFAQNLAQQALELIPQDFNENQRNYVANTLLNFSTVAGEALYNDTQLNFNLDQAVMITQIIAEWSFHKSVDLVRSGIPQQYWDPIMQKIAFTIFEIAKNAFSQNLPQDQCLQLIEHHVKKTYLDCIAELKDKNLIDEGLMEQAASQSNIDAMAAQQQAESIEQGENVQPNVQPNDNPQPNGNPNVVQEPNTVTAPTAKVLKLATLAMVFRKMQQEKVQTILNKFNADDAQSVIKFMGMNDLDRKLDPNTALKCLQEIRTNLPKPNMNLTPQKIIHKIQNISQYFDRTQLEQTLKLERTNVRKFVFTALEGEYYDIPPKVANIIATHLEDSV
jgi:hypothetical protein